MYWNMADLVNETNRAGSFFFSPDTMRSFGTRLCPSSVRRISHTDDAQTYLFLTSENNFDGSVRRFTLRLWTREAYTRESDGRKCYRVNVDTVGEFLGHDTRAAAYRELEKQADFLTYSGTFAQ